MRQLDFGRLRTRGQQLAREPKARLVDEQENATRGNAIQFETTCGVGLRFDALVSVAGAEHRRTQDGFARTIDDATRDRAKAFQYDVRHGDHFMGAGRDPGTPPREHFIGLGEHTQWRVLIEQVD
jgi:hypothetical protein